MALLAACAGAAAVAIRTRRNWAALAAPLLAPVGFLAFLAFTWHQTGVADAWIRTQAEGWGERLNLTAPRDDVTFFLDPPIFDTNIAIVLLGLVFVALALAVLLHARPPAAVLLYSVSVITLAVSLRHPRTPPEVHSTALPRVVVFSRYLRGVTFATLFGASAVLLGSLTILTVTTRYATP